MSERIYKSFTLVVKEVNEAERSFWATFSTEEPDRDGDIVMTSGWELENFLQNPVVMFAHKHDSPPVAQVTEIRREAGSLQGKLQFPTKAEYAFADTIYRLYVGGYLRAFSVGFRPIEREDIMEEATEGVEDGTNPRRTLRKGTRFTEQELVEVSVAPIPSNPGALAKAVEDGIITKDFCGECPIKKEKDPVVKQDTAHFTETVRKELEAIINKEGRVLSGKNRTLVVNVRQKIKELDGELGELLNRADSSGGKKDDKDSKSLDNKISNLVEEITNKLVFNL